MIRYVYCMTKSKHWFDVAEALFDNNIAVPVIWLGDDHHRDQAKRKFGTDVLDMNSYVHAVQDVDVADIPVGDTSFFSSSAYLRAKDRCLKMMDRIDLQGSFLRIDREAYFNKLCLLFISLIERNNPTHLVMAEAPHSHPQYLLYEICNHFDLEIAWFNNWMLGPIMNLQNMRSMALIKKQDSSRLASIDPYLELVDQYVANLQKKWVGQYQHQYMVNQVEALKISSRIRDFMTSRARALLAHSVRNLKDSVRKSYNPLNPFNGGPLTLLRNERARRNALLRQHNLYATKSPTFKEYAFFALHYEHERNTNPDGGIYHEQLIAILKLREWLPEHIGLVVKEHPTQIYHIPRGPRGRSPLIYKFISSIKGLDLVRYDADSVSLQKKSVFTATITGTVALEAAVNGQRSIVFGNAWFDGCPNIVRFDSLGTFEEFLGKSVKPAEEVTQFLRSQMKLYCIPANQNFSAEIRNKELVREGFDDVQHHGVHDLMASFLAGSS